MKLLGVTITPKRRDTDFGEDAWTPIATISNAVIIPEGASSGAPSVSSSDPGKGYAQSGSLFVPRGTDLQDGDKFQYQGRSFTVVGEANWDMNHTFSGQDLGIVEYAIRLGG